MAEVNAALVDLSFKPSATSHDDGVLDFDLDQVASFIVADDDSAFNTTDMTLTAIPENDKPVEYLILLIARRLLKFGTVATLDASDSMGTG